MHVHLAEWPLNSSMCERVCYHIIHVHYRVNIQYNSIPDLLAAYNGRRN